MKGENYQQTTVLYIITHPTRHYHSCDHSDHSPLEKINLKDIKDSPQRLQRMLLRIQEYDVKIRYVPGVMVSHINVVKPFECHSDHSPLEKINLKDIKDSPQRLQRMLLRIQEYDVKIRYVPGKMMLLADPLSRLKPLPGKPIADMDVRVCHIRCIQSINGQIRELIQNDPTLCSLMEVVYKGWPKYHRDCPVNLRPYWELRDRLSIEDGLIVVGERVIIPEPLRKQMLDNLHEGHMGIEKCKLRARSTMFWPGMDKDIENKVYKCPTCQERQKALPRQPLEPHEVPTRPWQILGTDIFFWEKDEWLLIDDYFSKFPVVREIPKGKSNSATVIDIFKSVMSEFGKPERVVSDNGGHYSSEKFKKFAAEWGFEHITASPRYPRSNGFIERQVQTVKRTMDKAKASGQDIQMALLCLRSTPIDNVLPSPAELLTRRKYLNNLPGIVRNTDPRAEEIVSRLTQRQVTQKHYHDKSGVQHRAPFIVNQPVYAYNTITKRWAPGVVCMVHDDRSVSVLMNTGVIYRRNTAHVRPNHDITTRIIPTHVPSGQNIVRNVPSVPSVQQNVPIVTSNNMHDSIPTGADSQANSGISDSRRDSHDSRDSHHPIQVQNPVINTPRVQNTPPPPPVSPIKLFRHGPNNYSFRPTNTTGADAHYVGRGESYSRYGRKIVKPKVFDPS